MQLSPTPSAAPVAPPVDPPVDPATGLAVGMQSDVLRVRARQAYRDSVTTGAPLTGKALGELFGRSERWGRNLIADVRAADAGPDAAASRRRANGTNGGNHGAPSGTVGNHGTASGTVGTGTGGAGSGRHSQTRGGSADGGGGGAGPAAAAVPGPAPAGALVVAWLGFGLGTVVSVAANVLHTWLLAEHEPQGWAPGIAPQIGSAVWPIVLLLAVEVLSRVRWVPGFWWALARYGGASTVAVGSAVISYGHLHELLLAWDYGPLGAAVGQFVLDGLMTVSGFALLAMSRTAHAPPAASPGPGHDWEQESA